MLLSLLYMAPIAAGLLGWWIGRWQGARELQAYRTGVADSAKSCWVRTQVPIED